MTIPDAPADTRWLDDVETRAWRALLEVGSGLFDLLSADLKAAAGLTLEDYEVLHLLSEAPERSMRVGTLANAMLTQRTRLSQRLDRLSARGVVSRSRSVDDGRAIDVSLTASGQELLVALAPLHLTSVRSRVFDHLAASHVECLALSLQKLSDYLRTTRAAT